MTDIITLISADEALRRINGLLETQELRRCRNDADRSENGDFYLVENIWTVKMSNLDVYEYGRELGVVRVGERVSTDEALLRINKALPRWHELCGCLDDADRRQNGEFYLAQFGFMVLLKHVDLAAYAHKIGVLRPDERVAA